MLGPATPLSQSNLLEHVELGRTVSIFLRLRGWRRVFRNKCVGRVLPSPDDVDDLSHGERPPGKIQSRAAELRPASGTLCLAFAGLRRRARDLCSRNASHSRANLTT